MWKWLIGLGVAFVLLIGVAGVVVWKSGAIEKLQQQMNPKLKAMEVRFGQAEKGEVVRTINAPGEIEPKTKVEISAQVSARIVALPFDAGDAVKAGDVLVTLDNRDLQALLDSARAQLRGEEARLEGARAALANAEVELGRNTRLAASGDVPKSQVDTAQLQYDQASSTLRQIEQAIESAKANIQRAEKDLDNTVIRSPINGVITKRNAEVGETVVVGTINSPGSVILELADLDTMLLMARVDEANISKVLKGQKAVIYINAYADLKLSGVVEHVGLKREVDTNGTRYFETKIAIERPKDLLLRSGLTASVDVAVESFEDVIKVPSQAVLDRAVDDLPKDITKDNPNVDATKKFTRVVFIEEQGKAKPVPVKTGVSDQTHTIVVGGLEPGAKIVTGPFKALTKLENGQLIKEEGAKDAPARRSASNEALPPPRESEKKPPGT